MWATSSCCKCSCCISLSRGLFLRSGLQTPAHRPEKAFEAKPKIKKKKIKAPGTFCLKCQAEALPGAGPLHKQPRQKVPGFSRLASLSARQSLPGSPFLAVSLGPHARLQIADCSSNRRFSANSIRSDGYGGPSTVLR